MAVQKARKQKKGEMKRKGEAGAAKNYITRNQALKKLQVTLQDFRRLCILKGIYPREPKSRKKANKGSTAPTTFYYIKDISYLQHEPVLGKLREHKTFAKKLSRALGRGQDGLAKNLEARHQGYRIDHIIKERYPTFTDSIKDVDDALGLIILFAHLPATVQVPSSVILNCARLAAEWQLYVIRSRSLRKVFLSVKGIYFQAEVSGQIVTWLVPYAFTQRVPADVDFRIMLTFLELYQTLLGFVLFKLFGDINLVYPPKVDVGKDEGGAGMDALLLEETSRTLTTADEVVESTVNKKATVKDVKSQIKYISKENPVEQMHDVEEPIQNEEPTFTTTLDAFPDVAEGALPAPSDDSTTTLFEPYFFFISREVTRPTLEFVIRCFGGRVGWDSTLGAGSPFDEHDVNITHHVVDRPVAVTYYKHVGKRAYVQPQWVIDCANAGKLLPTEEYGPGKILPAHLSPFVDDEEVRRQGGYVPERMNDVEEVENESEDEEVESDADEDDVEDKAVTSQPGPALLAAALDPSDETLLHAAEVEAEERGVAYSHFQLQLKQEQKRASKSGNKKLDKVKSVAAKDRERDLTEMMLTGKHKKLYNKMAYSKAKKVEERVKLETKKKALKKSNGKGKISVKPTT